MVGIYKFVGELPARMGGANSEAQGRGTLNKIRLCRPMDMRGVYCFDIRLKQ